MDRLAREEEERAEEARRKEKFDQLKAIAAKITAAVENTLPRSTLPQRRSDAVGPGSLPEAHAGWSYQAVSIQKEQKQTEETEP